MSVELERGRVYTVARGATKPRAGQGLKAGMDVVIKHFRDAFTQKLDTPSRTSGVFTVQYPEERLPLAEAFRNFPILLYDDATGQELCTSCFQCQRICPPQVIHMTQAKDPTTGKPVPAVAEFVLEYDACMSCGLCAEVCPFDAIKMDHEFELSTEQHNSLTIDKEGLNRPVSYYEQLAPTFWAEVKDGALKKLQGNVKRRPGAAGIAPQMIGKVPENPSTAAPPPAEAAPPASGDDKAARLAAIRAKNAAKAAGQEAPPADEQPAPVDEKAARLAAIRAKNAAKAAEQAGQEPPPADEQPAPADEKAARLAAIRAKNAAKRAAEEKGDASE